MSELNLMSISEIRDKLRLKEFSSVELTESYLKSIESSDSKINAYVEVTAEKAHDMAKESDNRIIAGKAGNLEGIPLGVKDLFATKGVHTQACSHILDGFKPFYESTVTQKLWDDGAVMLGKLNMDEFAMGSSNETSYYGPVVNPWKQKDSEANLTPGGSSGGSAAAVASFLCAGATATDTGGSIRQPASFTGTVGIKPTYGRCSRWGMIAFASSLDQAGPIARSVRDCAILLNSMAGPDDKDATCVDLPVPDYESSIGKSLKGIKVGIPKEYRVDNMFNEAEILWHKGIDWLKDAGAEIVDISLPHTKYALPAYYVIASAEASSNLSRYDGVRYGLRVEGDDLIDMYEKTRSAGFGKQVKCRIMIGTYVLSSAHYDAYYLRARKIRTLIKHDFDQAFGDGIDTILTPVTPSSAFMLGEKEQPVDLIKNYYTDIFTVTVNMAGLPAISVPAGLCNKGLPLGLQLIGKPFHEETLFTTAYAIEQAAGVFRPEKWW
ncbi:Aspartyl-tRNA(Asn) amidotransferase subunit A [Liberibacter crescens BT-1]|uniref:Glutamyl-tRNA(Gln) amidotransferase subunit A n=1 Tax=Liberibacter crescens (strain BT-1) TaxID=1215343 RepID=L0EVT9_LIBCB|nr:Asp-tRNA(Asn)/Glu-tRNA(Gln) amidotransferase subunit GatA [Liberibacter crescens]AGA64970.1 Aspartyl-tRNA(Asn) amidotransferase subunit A [Liberibacter crescens BT-1]AMC12989.1 glutamyl-tRNA amidotransferase [Liberibacter crescens]